MLAAALHRMAESEQDNGPIRFARLDATGTRLVAASWRDVRDALRREPAAPPPRDLTLRQPPTRAPSRSRSRAALRRIVAAMPPRVQRPLFVYVAHQIAALQALGRAVREWRRPPQAPASRSNPQPNAASVSNAPEPGEREDVLLLLGPESWRTPPDVARRARERGMRIVLLAQDILPLVRPDLFARPISAACRAWHRDILPQCDRVLAVSPVLAEMFWRHAAPATPAPKPIRIVRLGASHLDATAASGPQRPPRRPYVLCAAPLDASENHELLFRVWRRMADRRAADAIPTLVLAGPIGTLVDDLLRQLGNADCLDGAIQIVPHPTLADLAALYRDCLFTLCVSLHPGGARQVEQSFALGKPCVSSTLARPEAAVDLTRSFAPENLGEAYDAICATIDDGVALAAWESRIRTEFSPIAWDEAAAALAAAALA